MPCNSCVFAVPLDDDGYEPSASVQQGASAITLEEEEAIAAIGGPTASTYGEVTKQGFVSLARRCHLSSEDVFADLGSGLGLCSIQAVREFAVRRACGIELSRSRHNLAIANLPSTGVASRISFVHGDCAERSLWEGQDSPLMGVTVLYVSSLLFSSQLMSRIAAQIVSTRVGSGLRVVATLKRFRWGALRRAGFREKRAEPCEMSWTSAQPVYIYERDKRPFLQSAGRKPGQIMPVAVHQPVSFDTRRQAEAHAEAT